MILFIRKIIWQRQQVQMQVILPITISIAIITINSTLDYIRILRLFIKSIHGILLKGNYLWVMDTLETINGAHFGTNENDLGRVFGFSTEADTGFDWDKLKTTYSENYTLNTDLVSTGNGYLNIYYNGDLVKTFMKLVNFE